MFVKLFGCILNLPVLLSNNEQVMWNNVATAYNNGGSSCQTLLIKSV